MNAESVSKFIVQVGILPAIIAALLYLQWQTWQDGKASDIRWCETLAEHTASLQRLTDYVKERNHV